MRESEIIQKTPEPRTVESISRDLRALGLREGMTVIVHASLSSIGWVCGEAVAVIQALLNVVTEEGTLVMPAQTGLSDPAGWKNPPVPAPWVAIIRETMPAYDAAVTPTRGIGIIAETFRKWPGAVRSSHPNLSLSALGKNARRITEGQTIDYALGENSPLARIYDLDGYVLMLGTGYDTCTSLHLAEYRAPGAKPCRDGFPIMKDGRRTWVESEDIVLDSDIFPHIGADFEESVQISRGYVGSAGSRLFRQREAVDFATKWLTEYRKSHG
ncbi:aminoglycoside N(3)-acetyltransferase [Methanocella arvoryzae]|uniref:Aminoglycoside N3\'-acetyltransferase n=1 Tax=Methanocella arvoryzae (strain DSM 22066 / NBRC 105507 / MRE50) TaxID=351160 RepID=Q0W7I9_METAR|nr:AAC(3) family N-acetyltransferase [Methanocella arvoryzae]CAJ35654.1 aminoglycoside N3\'-acetyltransferase [Methanocella arvoryzae MRE50]